MQNKMLILNLVLAIAVVVIAVCLVKVKGNCQKDVNAEQTVLDNIATRTSIRDYEARPVEKEKVEKLLKAAMAAPTAMNRQPWHFVVVDERSVLNAIGGEGPNAKKFQKAPLAIIVCGDMSKTIDGDGRDFWVHDASAATENLLLAAHAMGLGAVWTGGFPAQDRVAALRKTLALPDSIVPLNAVAIGYPAEHPQPKDKFNAANISYNTFGKALPDND